MESESPTTQVAAAPSKDGDEGALTGNNGSKSATGDLTALEAKLKEKEKLVGALTKRLEQAAEQLDRLQRSGAKKGGRGGGGGLPPELVEEQKTLTEDLKRAVEQWEAMQTAATLGRIEMQVTELRDLIAGSGGSISVSAASASSSPASAPTATAEPAEDSGDAPAPGSWEALKAQMMAGEDGSAAPATAEPTAPETTATQEQVPSADEPSSEPISAGVEVEDVPDADPPAAIDFESADTNELQQAVEERDEFIGYLIRKMRVVETRRSLSRDWASVENVPEEMRERLEELEKRLDDTLRKAEVELSLERARLGREELKMRQLKEQLDKRAKSSGLSEGDDESADDDDDSKGGRWRRFLGMSGDEDE